MSAAVNSHRGLISSSWQCLTEACGIVPQNSNLSIFCSVGVISDIVFADFGLPTGSCGAGLFIVHCLKVYLDYGLECI